MKKQFRLTQLGIDEFKTELDGLVSRRSEVADAIKTAREQGDLSENAEYHAAKDEQQTMEARIAEIEYILANVEVIAKPKAAGAVQLGSSVALKSTSGKTKQFQVVGTVEADPLNGKISDESPIGLALMGKKLGEAVEIVTPADTTTYEVASIY
ncbi:MAG: transcription elongation factor GreA [Candidatus Saccharimonadales bacterium]